jgi:hypothetical protein
MLFSWRLLENVIWLFQVVTQSLSKENLVHGTGGGADSGRMPILLFSHGVLLKTLKILMSLFNIFPDFVSIIEQIEYSPSSHAAMSVSDSAFKDVFTRHFSTLPFDTTILDDLTSSAGTSEVAEQEVLSFFSVGLIENVRNEREPSD